VIGFYSQEIEGSSILRGFLNNYRFAIFLIMS